MSELGGMGHCEIKLIMMEKSEIKKYIMKTWNVSSGKRITEMLKRYFAKDNLKPVQSNLIETAKEIFNVDNLNIK